MGHSWGKLGRRGNPRKAKDDKIAEIIHQPTDST